MNFNLENATKKYEDLLIKYKLNTILEYANNISETEFIKINEYVKNNVPKQITAYKIIKANNKAIGCVLVTKHLDGALLDELYLEEKYRNKGIGTKIIKDILAGNEIVYLWVYKENRKAINLYKKLKFHIAKETETRYFMKYYKSSNQ